MTLRHLKVAAATGVVALTLVGCGTAAKRETAHRSRKTTGAQTESQRQAILDVLHRYASAYSDHSTQGLAAVFASSIERTSNATGSCVTTSGTHAVLAVYRGQFVAGSGRYELQGLNARSVSFAPGITEEGALEAQVTATYRITPPGSHGSILFVLERSPNAPWRIKHIGVGCATKVISPQSAVAQGTESGESAQGPAFLGVEVESMSAEDTADGIALSSLYSSDELHGCKPPKSGAMIQTVLPGGPAANAGLHGMTDILGGYGVGGDVIVALDGSAVLGAEGLISELAARKPGESAEITVVLCNGESETVTVTLGGREDDRSGMGQPELEVKREAECEKAVGNEESGTSEACAEVQAYKRAHPQMVHREEEQERHSRMQEGSRQYAECERNLHAREATLRKEESETAEPRPKLRHKLQEDAEECAELAEEARSGTDRALREENE